MWMMVPFILNSLLNFVVSLLVAKFLGPAEYGRFILALSVATVMQIVLFDWLRLSATRFYSERDRSARPQLRATLDASFLLLAALAASAGVALLLFGADIGMAPELAAAALFVAIANGAFDLSSALLRARFHDRAYSALVIAKNLLAFALTVGGAYYFASARVAFCGMILSVIGSLAAARGDLMDAGTDPRRADSALAKQFLAYGVPIVIANAIYQSVPLLDRLIVSRTLGFADAGQMSLAYEIGVRIVAALGTALDAILFQLAVLADKEEGADAGRASIGRNMGVVFAFVAPSVAGCWLILPSFEALFAPESFRGPFGRYFEIFLPALLAFALTNYAINPAFQLAHRLAPLIVGALVCALANMLAILLLPPRQGAESYALAQSIANWAGALTLIALLFTLEPMRPRARDIFGALLATAAMIAAGLHLRALAPGAATLLLQIVVGGAVYAALAFAFDVIGLRSVIAPKIAARLRRAQRVAPERR
jgi:O-antigen/teichoic acid export membrane protein